MLHRIAHGESKHILTCPSQAFRQHPRYRVIPYDEQKGTQIKKADSAEAWLQRYEVDRRSIFIGSLPYGFDDLSYQLRELLGELGDVVDVHVIMKDSRDGREPNVFAFVEFERADMAALAVERLVRESAIIFTEQLLTRVIVWSPSLRPSGTG